MIIEYSLLSHFNCIGILESLIIFLISLLLFLLFFAAYHWPVMFESFSEVPRFVTFVELDGWWRREESKATKTGEDYCKTKDQFVIWRKQLWLTDHGYHWQDHCQYQCYHLHQYEALLHGKPSPCALIGSFSVRILQYGPFPWKPSNPCIFVLEQSRQIQHLQLRQRKKTVKIVILHIETTSRS